MTADGEPDSGVQGNPDLGRLFQLLVRGQQNVTKVMSDLRDTAQRSLNMAQTFMVGTGPGGAYRSSTVSGGGPQDPLAGMTTSASLGAPRVFSVTPSGVASNSAGQSGPQAVPAGGTTLGSLRAQTISDLRRNWSKSLLGVWSPYQTQRPSGSSPANPQGAGPQVNAPAGGGGQVGPGPYGLGPSGMPPNPVYFGGYGSPHGMYGPYGPYGPSSGGYGPSGPYGGSGGGGGAGGGHGAGGGYLWGMNSGIGHWASRNIPGVGLVDKAFGEFRSQRDKNEYYQNIEGGSNLGGVSERASEEIYAASTSALLTDSEARAAFKGVTRLGYTGRTESRFSPQGGRQDALDFVYHGKTSYGASISESLQQLEVVSKNSTISLQGLQKALKDVSDTAGETGVNAQMARSQLMQLLQQGIRSGYGAGALSTAQNLQMGKTSLGRSYEDIDLSGQMGQQYAYMASSQMGMTYNQYTAMQTTDPLAAAQARAGENLSLLSQIFTQDEVNWIKKKAQSLGGRLDSNAALAIVPEFLRAFPNHNISVIQAQLAAFGIVNTSDPQKAVAYAFTLIAGNNGDLASAQKTSKANRPMSAKAAANASKSSESGFIKGFDTKKKTPGWGMQLLGSLVETATLGFVDGIGVTDSKAMQAYKDTITRNKGQRNPVIENLLKTINDEDQAKIIVHTSSGERVVSLADAIKNHSREVSSGEASFVSGAEKGKTVQQILGAGGVNAAADWTGEAGASHDRTGQTLKSWQKSHPGKAASGTGVGANGKVVIDLSDSARQLLKIASTSGVEGAYGEGAPPLNFYNWNANR